MAVNFSNSRAVVLIGGGFAGLTTALALSRDRPRFPIILVEPRPRFVFIPLLYELLSGEVRSWEVAPSFKNLIAGKGIVVIQEFAQTMDFDRKLVITSSGHRISYSQLVIATGSKPDFFGVPGACEHALMFHQIEDVQILRDLISRLQNCSPEKKSLLIVGAGPTGVELACKVSDLLNNQVQIHLIESAERVLPKGQSFNQEQVELALKKRRVKIHLQTSVIAVTADSVQLQTRNEEKNDISILAHSGLVWTAGVQPVLPMGTPPENLIEGRISIDSALRVHGSKDIFAIGDIACNADNTLKATAQVAMQQGEIAAKNIIATREGRSLEPFLFRDLGEMLSLGIGDATITGLGVTISGPLAFQLRRMAYLSKMPRLSLGIRSASAWLIPDDKKSF